MKMRQRSDWTGIITAALTQPVALLALTVCVLAAMPGHSMAADEKEQSDLTLENSPEKLYEILIDAGYDLERRYLAGSKLKLLGERGDPEACFLLGQAYAKRSVTGAAVVPVSEGNRPQEVNYRLVIPLWRKAAEAGHVHASLQLGDLYAKGATDERSDIVSAVRYWLIAAGRGNTEARDHIKKNLPKLEAGDKEGSMFRQALGSLSAAGDVAATVRLGKSYMDMEDYGRARNVLRRAIEQDSDEAEELISEIDRREAKHAKTQPTASHEPQTNGQTQDDYSSDPAEGNHRNQGSDNTTSQPKADAKASGAWDNTQKILLTVAIAWGILSLFGISAGLKGSVIICRGWWEVFLAAVCLGLVVYLITVRTGISASQGVEVQWGAMIFGGAIALSLAFRAYRSNRSIIKALLALLTQFFLVAILVLLAMIALAKVMAVAKAKNRRDRTKDGIAALGAIAGAGIVTTLINKLIRKGAEACPIKASGGNSGLGALTTSLPGGIGLSVGVPGLRVGRSIWGHIYVQCGIGGIYYRQRLQGLHTAVRPAPTLHGSAELPLPHGENSDFVEDVANSTPQGLAATIQMRSSRPRLCMWFCFVWLCLLTSFIVTFAIEPKAGTTSVLGVIFVLTTFLAVVCVPVLWICDRSRRRTKLAYELDPTFNAQYGQFVESFAAFCRCEMIFRVKPDKAIVPPKHHSGCDTSFRIGAATLRFGTPRLVTSNLSFPTIVAGTRRIHFLPDTILIVAGSHISTVSYEDMSLGFDLYDCAEEDNVPSDAEKVSTTWKHPKNDGSPDYRFKNNFEVPVIRYALFRLRFGERFHMRLMASNVRTARDFVDQIKALSNFLAEQRTKAAAAVVPHLAVPAETPVLLTLPSVSHSGEPGDGLP